MRGFAHRSAFNRRLENDVDSLVKSGYLAIDPATGDELWRISVRVAAFKDVDYGQFTKRLQKLVAPFIDQHNTKIKSAVFPDEPAGQQLVSVIYTGVIPIVYKAQRALLEKAD